MVCEYGINLRKIQGQFTTPCLYTGGVWGVCLVKNTYCETDFWSPTQSYGHHSWVESSMWGTLCPLFSSAKSKLRFEIYHEETVFLSPYSPFLLLLQTHQMMVSLLTIQFVLLFIWAPLEATIIYSTIRPPTDPRKQFPNMTKPLN